jgi:hypothetical protein
LPGSRNEDIIKADKPSVSRYMRMILHPLFRTVAVLATIAFACAPFGATMAHANNAPHHTPIKTADHGQVIVAATPMTMHDGKATPCCPATGGQTDDGSCSVIACSSLPGALTVAFVAERPMRPMRDCFLIPQDTLSPHNLAPEHGPPRT